MCKFFKSILSEVIVRVKKWSIRKQMMLCYILGISIIVSLVIGVIILNTFLLQQQTVDKVESTRDSQANEDIEDLAKTGSQVVYSRMYEGLLSLSMLQEMLIGMFREGTFALDYTNLYEYSQLNTSEMYRDPERYGDQLVSITTPTILYMNAPDNEGQILAQKISRFSYVLPHLLEIYKYAAIRYTMYFDVSGFVYFFPGINLTSFKPEDYMWYNEFMVAEKTITTPSYNDIMGNSSNEILSIVLPLYSNTEKTERIGILCGDWLIKSLYSLLQELKYLDQGYQYLVYKDGTIIDSLNNPWINKDIKNLNNLTYNEFWNDVLRKPLGIHYLIEEKDIWRVGSAPVVQDPTSNDDWTFILLILVRESDVMSYKEEAKNLIKNEGIKFILITMICSLLASIVVICFIHCQAMNISKPIQGIIDFTIKLNSEENPEEVLKELNNLPEGTDQTARLVHAYKQLARGLIEKKDSEGKKHDAVRVYPPNELRRIDKSELMKDLILIPLNFG